MNTQIIFKVDTKLKEKAMKKARGEGVPFAYVLKMATQAYVNNRVEIKLVSRPKLNNKTKKELIKISQDIKNGKDTFFVL